MQKVSLYTVLPLVASSVIVWAQAQEGKIRLDRPQPAAASETPAQPAATAQTKADTAEKKPGLAELEELKSGFKIPKPFFFNMYVRASAQDDFGYNAPTLGWSPFYGRLMNETPWLMADFGYHVVRPETPGAPRATLFMRIEGGSYRG